MASADLTSAYEVATVECDNAVRTFQARAYVAPADGIPQLRIQNDGDHPAVIIVHNTTVTNTNPASPVQADGERILPAGDQVILDRGRASFRHRAGGSATALTVENIG